MRKFTIACVMTSLMASGSISAEENKGIIVPAVKEPGSICYSDRKEKAESWLNNFIPDVCANIDTSPDVENSRYLYQNPNGGCDLGLELPGLPAWGSNLTGLSSCQIARAITGDMVDKVNEGMDGLRDAVVEGIENEVKSQIGLDLTDMNVDLNEIAEKAVK